MKHLTSLFPANILLITCLIIFPLLNACKNSGDNQKTTTLQQEEITTSKPEGITNTTEAEGEGGEPWVLDIEEATVANNHYRIEEWTGKHMQMVLMSIKPGEEIDLEIHKGHDQFIRIEQGEGRVLMGRSEEDLFFDENVTDDWAIFIPAGYYHNVKNTGSEDLKVYTIYAPKEHPRGTLHSTYEEAREAHQEEH